MFVNKKHHYRKPEARNDQITSSMGNVIARHDKFLIFTLTKLQTNSVSVGSQNPRLVIEVRGKPEYAE